VFKPRQSNSHYLQFIEVVTFYCQHQRESQFDVHTGEEYIETTLEDIKVANTLIKDSLLCKSAPLNGAMKQCSCLTGNSITDLITEITNMSKI